MVDQVTTDETGVAKTYRHIVKGGHARSYEHVSAFIANLPRTYPTVRVMCITIRRRELAIEVAVTDDAASDMGAWKARVGTALDELWTACTPS